MNFRKRVLATASLIVLLVLPVAAHALELAWVGCGITRKAFMADLAEAYKRKTGTDISIAGGGATKGIRSVAANEADIGGACRFRLDRTRIESAVKMIPVAWDALVVITHKDNPVNSVSLQQLRDLYLGKITNWSELDGSDAPIELLIREGTISGVGYTLRERLFENVNQEFVSSHTFKSSGPLEKATETNLNAIAVTGVASANKRDVKILQLEGMDPSFENIRKGNYILYRPLFLTYNKKSERNGEADRFIKFALGPQGRGIIKRNKVVPYFDGMLLIQNRLREWKGIRDKALKKEM
ncbi:MAG: phosphate ABC transporter substrate-binding protein [Sedimenticola sp.]